jgi:hypothetical protein
MPIIFQPPPSARKNVPVPPAHRAYILACGSGSEKRRVATNRNGLAKADHASAFKQH